HRTAREVRAIERVVVAVFLTRADELSSVAVYKNRRRRSPIGIPRRIIDADLPTVLDRERVEIQTHDRVTESVGEIETGSGGDEDLAVQQIDCRRSPHAVADFALLDER